MSEVDPTTGGVNTLVAHVQEPGERGGGQWGTETADVATAPTTPTTPTTPTAPTAPTFATSATSATSVDSWVDLPVCRRSAQTSLSWPTQ